MTPEVLTIALMAGAANWAFRYLPTRFDAFGGAGDGLVARFLAAVGPAAICTLFVASLLPALMALPAGAVPLIAGVCGVLAAFAATRSVAAATFAGALAVGLATWATG
jgi:Branched-chain amino acid transport protein (AzlD)